MSTRTELQPHIRPVYVDPHLHEEVKKYADTHGTSVSEVLRDAMAGFTAGSYPARRRIFKRVNIWVEPEEYAAFVKKAKESGVTIRHALEIAMEETL